MDNCVVLYHLESSQFYIYFIYIFSSQDLYAISADIPLGRIRCQKLI